MPTPSSSLEAFPPGCWLHERTVMKIRPVRDTREGDVGGRWLQREVAREGSPVILFGGAVKEIEFEEPAAGSLRRAWLRRMGRASVISEMPSGCIADWFRLDLH